MKRILVIFSAALTLSCNMSVDKDNDKDSSEIDLDKVENKIEQWGDSAEEKYKDIKRDIKDRLDDDSLEKRK